MRGGRRVLSSRGGTETNRARVKRRGAEKKRGKRMRKCQHDNDRVSERGSVNERLTERDEFMWNTKGDRHCHLFHCMSASLTLFLSLPLPFFTCLFILLSTLFCFLQTLSHCFFRLSFLCQLPSLTLVSTISASTPSFLFLHHAILF